VDADERADRSFAPVGPPELNGRRQKPHEEDAMDWPTAAVIIAAIIALTAIVTTYLARPKDG
jgi:hypothetical protein